MTATDNIEADVPLDDALLYGLLAEFDDAQSLLNATHRCYGSGYRRMDAYTPFPVEGLAEALGFHRSRIPLIVLIGGLVGGLGGYFMLCYSAIVSYPIDVGGRPLHSWPSFVPVTFEMTILGAALFAVLGMLALNGLPMPYHPVFNVPGFALASQERFFLCIEKSDLKFDRVQTRQFMESLQASKISEVPQ